MPAISVVIPTRNRPGLLGRCLASLCAQTLDPDRFEICVVNNGAVELTNKVIALVNTHYPAHNLSMIDEPKLGVANARNTGVAHTTAPLIAQSDDDVVLPPDWLERFVDGFAREERIGKIGGAIVPQWAAPHPDWVSHSMLSLLAATAGLGSEKTFTAQALPAGNGCYRREALLEAGGFPPTLGRKGNSLLANEQVVDMVMHSKGWKLFYDPDIKIEHILQADRLNPVWLRRAAFWQGVSDYACGVYLAGHNIIAPVPSISLPLSHENWGFINNSAEIPTDDGLARLRGLGYTLARSGFIPTR